MTATVVVMLACATVVTLAWAFQRSLIYFPFAQVPPRSQAGLDDVEPVSFDAAAGCSGCMGGSCRGGASPLFTLVVFNGNAGNRAYRADAGAGVRRARRRRAAVRLSGIRGQRRPADRTRAGEPTRAPRARTWPRARTSIPGASCTSASRWARPWRWAWPWSIRRRRWCCARRSRRWPTSALALPVAARAVAAAR